MSEGRRRRGRQRRRWLDGITDSMGHELEQARGVGDGTGKPGLLQSMGSQRVRHEGMTELKSCLTLLLPHGL